MTTVTAELRTPTPDSSFLQKPLSLIDVACNLYGFIPEDEDSRWDFLSRYDDIKSQIGFSAMNFTNAWGATYLSPRGSYRSGFVTTLNTENSLQLDRALDNLSQITTIAERFDSSRSGHQEFDMRLSLTDRLTADPAQPKNAVTPCPEALFQIQLHEDGEYLARVGFNIHTEAFTTVLSIANIQGIPGGVMRNRAFESKQGISPFNALVQRTLALANIQAPQYDIRGMINPARGNAQLYWGVLTEEAVEMYHAHRKQTANQSCSPAC